MPRHPPPTLRISRSICDYVTFYILAKRAFREAMRDPRGSTISAATTWTRGRENASEKLLQDWGW